MVNNQPFEIPQQFRDLAEQNVEQASAAYKQFMDAMVQAIGMWWDALPPNEMTSGVKTVQDRAVRFAKQNADAGFALASSLANAQGYPGSSAAAIAVCAEPDADVCGSGAGAWSPDDCGCKE